MSNNPEPGTNPVVTVEPGEAEASRRSPEPSVAPKPEPSPAPKPKVEVKTRKLPTAFYVGAFVAGLGVAVMLWASARRIP